MNIYVTGIAGFLGSEIAAQLIEAGHHVLGCDNMVTGHRRRVPTAADWDVRSVEHLDEIDLLDADMVVHTAAIARSGWPDRAEVWQANVVATMRLRDVFPGPIVHCSSSIAAYPDANEYARSKAEAERVMADAMILRPGNIYGAGQSRVGPSPNVLAAFATQALKGSVTVDGTGEQTRDFVHVVDCAAAFVAAVERFTPGVTVDVCTGVQTSIGDLAARFGVPVVHGPSRNDPPVIEQDPGPAVWLLGWRPVITLKEGLAEVLP